MGLHFCCTGPAFENQWASIDATLGLHSIFMGPAFQLHACNLAAANGGWSVDEHQSGNYGAMKLSEATLAKIKSTKICRAILLIFGIFICGNVLALSLR